MEEIKRLVVFLLALCCHVTISESRLLPRISSFDKEQSFNGMRIILSSGKNAVTDNESFLYATCSSQEETFKENRCNVTVETPAFDNGATFKESCSLHINVANPKIESLTKLTLQPFGDDKALLAWLVKDYDWNSKYAVVRVLVMSTCMYTDVMLPANKLQAVAPNQNGFDVVIRNKTFCGSENCKLSYDVHGKKLSGPTQFLTNVKFHQLVSLIPAAGHGPVNKGQPQFYALATVPTEHRLSLLQVGQDGKGIELLTVPDYVMIKLSNSYDMLSACWTTEKTNVTCRQFDSRANRKLGVVLEFVDEPGWPVRWIQPHNYGTMEPSGLLLVTGQTSRENDREVASFSINRIHSDGSRDRPLEIGGLQFICTNIKNLHVDVSENDPEDELCIHFACDRTDYGEFGSSNSLKFGSRCIPRRHVTLTKRQLSVIN